MTDCFELIAYYWSYRRRISNYRKLQPDTPLVPQHYFFKHRKYFADFNFRALILTAKFRENWTTRKFPILRYLILRGYYRKCKRYNLQHLMTSRLISSVLTWIKRSMLDATLYRKKLKQGHRKTDPEKLERRGNKPSPNSQSDDHISMLSRVNKKTWQVPRTCQKIISEDDWLQIKTPIEWRNWATYTCTIHNTTFTVINPNYLDTKKK